MDGNDLRDRSYTSKLKTVSSDEYEHAVAARRAQAAAFFSVLPPAIAGLADGQLELVDTVTREVLLELETLKDTWSHELAGDELLGQQFDEKTAALWPCSRATGAFLHMMTRAARPRLILELGTSAGYSTLWMAAACRTYGGRIKTVEYLPQKVEMARRYFARCGAEDVIELVHADIRTVLDNWQGDAPDLVFMDANKEWQKYYLSRLKEIMRPGGMIITDNAFDAHDISEDYLQDLRQDYVTVFAGLDTAGTLLSIKK